MRAYQKQLTTKKTSHSEGTGVIVDMTGSGVLFGQRRSQLKILRPNKTPDPFGAGNENYPRST